jgi:transposase-like protein
VGRAICSIATKFGMTPETLRRWVRSAETDQGRRPGLTTDERERLKAVEKSGAAPTFQVLEHGDYKAIWWAWDESARQQHEYLETAR